MKEVSLESLQERLSSSCLPPWTLRRQALTAAHCLFCSCLPGSYKGLMTRAHGPAPCWEPERFYSCVPGLGTRARFLVLKLGCCCHCWCTLVDSMQLITHPAEQSQHSDPHLSK